MLPGRSSSRRARRRREAFVRHMPHSLTRRRHAATPGHARPRAAAACRSRTFGPLRAGRDPLSGEWSGSALMPQRSSLILALVRSSARERLHRMHF